MNAQHSVACRKCGKEYQLPGWEPFEHFEQWFCWNEVAPGIFCRASNRIKAAKASTRKAARPSLEEVAAS